MKNGFIKWCCVVMIGGCMPWSAGAETASKDTDETLDLLELFKQRAEQRKKPYRKYRFSDTVKFHQTDIYNQKKEIDLGDVDDPKWAPEDHHHVFGNTPLPPGVLLDDGEGELDGDAPGFTKKGRWFTPAALDRDESEGKSHLFEQADPEAEKHQDRHALEKETVSHIERQRAAEERLRMMRELGLDPDEVAAAAKEKGEKPPSIDPSDNDTRELTPEEVEALLAQALAKDQEAKRETAKRQEQNKSPHVDSANAYRPTVADSDLRREAPRAHVTKSGAQEGIEPVDPAVHSRSVQDRRIGAQHAADPIRVGHQDKPEATLSRTAKILSEISTRNQLKSGDASPSLSRALSGHTLSDVVRATHERLERDNKPTAIASPLRNDALSASPGSVAIRTLGDLRRSESNTLAPSLSGPAAMPAGIPGAAPALSGPAGAINPSPLPAAGSPATRNRIDFFNPDRNLGIGPASKRDPLRF